MSDERAGARSLSDAELRERAENFGSIAGLLDGARTGTAILALLARCAELERAIQGDR